MKKYNNKSNTSSIHAQPQLLNINSPIAEPVTRTAEQLLHELQIYQIELEMQNEHLRITQASLEESRDRYVDLYEFAPVGYILLSDQGIITEANLTAAKLLCSDRRKLLSHRFNRFITPEDTDRWHLFSSKFKKHEEELSIELTLQDSQGTKFPVQLNCIAINSIIRISITDISKQKQTEEDLRKSQSELQEAMRIANMGRWQLEFATGHICWSEELYHIFGLNPDLPTPSLSEHKYLFTPESWKKANSAVLLNGKSGIPFEIELEIIRADLTYRCVNLRGEATRDVNETIIGLHGKVQDITERKKNDLLLNQLKAMINISLDGFYIVDIKGRIVLVNQAYAQMLGYSPNELIGIHLSQLEAVEGEEQIKANVKKVISQGFELIETRQFHKNGQEIDIEISVAYLDKFERFCVFCRDISQRKLMERKLKASEAKFRSIIEISPVPKVLIDKKSNILMINPAFVEAFGYEIEEIPNLEAWWTKACTDPDYRNWVKTILQDARQERRDLIPLEVTIQCKNNTVKTILASNTPLHNQSEDLSLVVLYDITQRIQIEAKYNSIFKASVEGFITVDIHNEILASNPAIDTIFGYKPKELVGFNIQKLIPSLLDNSNEPGPSRQDKSIIEILEIEGIHRNGNSIPLDLSIAKYFINNTLYYTYIIRDITVRKFREQQDREHLNQLAHVTRLGLLGEMASGIAHEVNQPLTAISTYAQVNLNLIKRENLDLVKLTDVSTKIQEQALRAGQIIHRMKRFCLSKSQQRSSSDINELINECVSMCTDLLKQNRVKLILELASDLPLISVDHIQIEQVLINLIRNAIDAILGASDEKQGQIAIQTRVDPSNEIEVRIKDNGPGIHEGQKAKILMPFHTTKEKGMGMGLSISRSLIEAHNGKMYFNSQFGKGSTFYFTLPIIS
jgi:PAS domain S-box-containing protein